MRSTLKFNDTELSVEETKECKIMRLLLKIKHDTPVRKTALRQHHGHGPRFQKSIALSWVRGPSIYKSAGSGKVKVISDLVLLS
jgi:hypothetical protein